MIESQTGHFASRAFTTIPSGPEFAYPSDLFRILLLRRLRLPLPLSARYCTCRRTLDSFGDHRAACATSGALRSRAGPLERAAARVCREAGARVTTNVLVSDLDLTTTNRIDNRRIGSHRSRASAAQWSTVGSRHNHGVPPYQLRTAPAPRMLARLTGLEGSAQSKGAHLP